MLIGDAVLELRYVPLWSDLREPVGYAGPRGLGVVDDIVVVVLAALALVALIRMRPAPQSPEPEGTLAGFTVASSVFASVAYVFDVLPVISREQDVATVFQWTWFMVASAVVVSYAMLGRPTALAPGLLCRCPGRCPRRRRPHGVRRHYGPH
uniref:hypothetical protein n=1 Tax=Paractinoplanes polyasparticus TaxID=2856853 RepID=UPI001C84ED8C|nr:hypothetical protein [Actinoplanes polyasparticus]